MKIQKNQIVNYIPLSILVLLKERSLELENSVKLLNLDISYRKDDTMLFFIFRSVIFLSFGHDPARVFDFLELKKFLFSVQEELYSFRADGFVSIENMESNKIFNIFRSFYPKHKNVFCSMEEHSNLNELEHYHNLIILLLLYEIEKTLEFVSTREEIDDLKTERSLLNKTLSGGIRVSLSKNRLVLLNKKYVGFDTEYHNVNSMENKLLCYTTASVSETIVKIRSPEVDFSLSVGHSQSHLPQTASLINIVIKLIRRLRGKKDFELTQLENRLSLIPDLQRLTLRNKDVIFIKKIEFEKIESNFYDLRSDTSQFSFYGLLEKELEIDKKEYDIRLEEPLRELNLKPTIKNECVLVAHFTTADVSLFYDFNEIKTKFTVISKSFLTLDKYLSYKN